MTYSKKSMLYTPPDGYYDLPFTWTYDASKLTQGKTYLNQYVYLQGGYGDFVLRRVVGLGRILAGQVGTAVGQFQIQDNGGKYIESAPVYGAISVAAQASTPTDDMGFAPELLYQETGAIKFDLRAVNLPTALSTAQIAFQGVRRMKGTTVKNPTYQASPRSYTYIVPAGVGGPVGSYSTVRTKVNNYDFELHQTIILETTGGVILVASENGGVRFQNLTPGSLTLSVVAGVNTPFTFSVVGTTIVATGVDTIQGFLAALATSAASGLVATSLYLNATPNTTPMPYAAPQVMGASAYVPAQGLASIWLYDANRVATSSAPLVDIFMDGSCKNQGGLYENGAVVTPLWYPKDSQIQMDVYSNTTTGSNLLIMLVGRQYVPC